MTHTLRAIGRSAEALPLVASRIWGSFRGRHISRIPKTTLSKILNRSFMYTSDKYPEWNRLTRHEIKKGMKAEKLSELIFCPEIYFDEQQPGLEGVLALARLSRSREDFEECAKDVYIKSDSRKFKEMVRQLTMVPVKDQPITDIDPLVFAKISENETAYKEWFALRYNGILAEKGPESMHPHNIEELTYSLHRSTRLCPRELASRLITYRLEGSLGLERTERLKFLERHEDKEIRSRVSHINKCRENALKNLLGKTSKDFQEGDFPVADPLDAKRFKNAYEAIGRLGEWDFFDQEPPHDREFDFHQRYHEPVHEGYYLSERYSIEKIKEEVANDEHTEKSFERTIRKMFEVRVRGWEGFVSQELDKLPQLIGMLPTTEFHLRQRLLAKKSSVLSKES